MVKVLLIGKYSDNVSIWTLKVISLRIVCNAFPPTNCDHPFSTIASKWNIGVEKTLEIMSWFLNHRNIDICNPVVQSYFLIISFKFLKKYFIYLFFITIYFPSTLFHSQFNSQMVASPSQLFTAY